MFLKNKKIVTKFFSERNSNFSLKKISPSFIEQGWF